MSETRKYTSTTRYGNKQGQHVNTSEQIEDKLKYLTKIYGESKQGVLRLAINLLYMQAKGELVRFSKEEISNIKVLSSKLQSPKKID